MPPEGPLKVASKLMSLANGFLADHAVVNCPSTHAADEHGRISGCIHGLWAKAVTILLNAHLPPPPPNAAAAGGGGGGSGGWVARHFDGRERQLGKLVRLEECSADAKHVVAEATMALLSLAHEAGDANVEATCARLVAMAESLLAREPSDAAAAGATLLTWRLLAHGTERLARVPFLRAASRDGGESALLGDPVATLVRSGAPAACEHALKLLDAALDAALGPPAQLASAPMESDDFFELAERAKRALDWGAHLGRVLGGGAWRPNQRSLLRERLQAWVQRLGRADPLAEPPSLATLLLRCLARAECLALKAEPSRAIASRLRAADTAFAFVLLDETGRWDALHAGAMQPLELRTRRGAPVLFLVAALRCGAPVSTQVLSAFLPEVEQLWLRAMVEPEVHPDLPLLTRQLRDALKSSAHEEEDAADAAGGGFGGSGGGGGGGAAAQGRLSGRAIVLGLLPEVAEGVPISLDRTTFTDHTRFQILSKLVHSLSTAPANPPRSRDDWARAERALRPMLKRLPRLVEEAMGHAAAGAAATAGTGAAAAVHGGAGRGGPGRGGGGAPAAAAAAARHGRGAPPVAAAAAGASSLSPAAAKAYVLRARYLCVLLISSLPRVLVSKDAHCLTMALELLSHPASAKFWENNLHRILAGLWSVVNQEPSVARRVDALCERHLSDGVGEAALFAALCTDALPARARHRFLDRFILPRLMMPANAISNAGSRGAAQLAVRALARLRAFLDQLAPRRNGHQGQGSDDGDGGGGGGGAAPPALPAEDALVLCNHVLSAMAHAAAMCSGYAMGKGQSGAECSVAEELWVTTARLFAVEVAASGDGGGGGARTTLLAFLAARSEPRAALLLTSLGLIWLHRTHGALARESSIAAVRDTWQIAYTSELGFSMEEVQMRLKAEWPWEAAAAAVGGAAASANGGGDLASAAAASRNHLPDDGSQLQKRSLRVLPELLAAFRPLANALSASGAKRYPQVHAAARRIGQGVALLARYGRTASGMTKNVCPPNLREWLDVHARRCAWAVPQQEPARGDGPAPAR